MGGWRQHTPESVESLLPRDATSSIARESEEARHHEQGGVGLGDGAQLHVVEARLPNTRPRRQHYLKRFPEFRVAQAGTELEQIRPYRLARLSELD